MPDSGIGLGSLFSALVAMSSLLFMMFFLPDAVIVGPAGNSPTQAKALALTAHDPILIDGNGGFTNASGVTWGSGTASDPYVVEGWDVDASTADGISIQNTDAHFIIRNCYVHYGWWNYDGISLFRCVNGILENNTCSNDFNGIALQLSSNNILVNNNCSSNDWASIALFSSCNNNTLSNNICSNDGNGLYLESSSDNTLCNNTCSNDFYGIHIWWSSSNNALINNTCSNNYYGIWLESTHNTTLDGNILIQNGILILGSDFSYWNTHNIDTSNTVNGRPVYYCKDQNGSTVPDGAGQVILANCTNFTIENQNLSDTDSGIILGYSSGVFVANNTCSNNVLGLYLFSSSDNILINNTCSNDDWGICLVSSSDNTLSNNTCSNSVLGLYLISSSDNALSNNTCSNNGDGICLILASNNNEISRNLVCNNAGYGVNISSWSSNHIWNNTFIGNNGATDTYNPSHVQAFNDGATNWWNSTDGYGNSWSDWTAPDDVPPYGIVDLPYSVPGHAGAKDYYPLTSIENISPITTASSSGAVGTNGWFKSNVSVSLSAADAGSGVDATFYRIGTSGSWLDYSSSFVLSSDGNSTVQFYSMDNAGNSESAKNITVKIDKTSPTLIVNQTAGFEATVNYTVISWVGSDATSGIDRFEVSIDGAASASVGMAMSRNFSGLTDGIHNVTVKAVDAAGNEVNQTIQFTVDTSTSGGGIWGDLMLYGSIVVIIVIIVAAIEVIMMRKKKSPPMRLDDMKAEPPSPPAT